MKNFFKIVIVFLVTLEARLVLQRFRPYIIAVTGNLGKTSTKDAIYSALDDGDGVLKSKKSMNSDVGVPLTILGEDNAWFNPISWMVILIRGAYLAFFAKEYPHTLVLEVGADHPGDIAAIASWLRPDVAVVTGIPDIPAHVANFASADALAKEKRELVRHVRPGGWVLLNADDERALLMKSEKPTATMTYGFQHEADVTGSHDGIAYEGLHPIGMQCRINHEGSSVPLVIKGALGRQHCYPMLAAAAVAVRRGKDLVHVAGALAKHQTPPGRMRLIEGKKGVTIIDDSYNASPLAMTAALDTLEKIETHGRRIAILGDMRELGIRSVEAHAMVGTRAAQVLDLLYTVGEESKVLVDAAHKAGMPAPQIVSFGYRAGKAAAEELLPQLKEGDVVLVKGSQNKIRLEEAVKVLMANPDDAAKMLVRQEKEWQGI